MLTNTTVMGENSMPKEVHFSKDVVFCVLDIAGFNRQYFLPSASLTTWRALREELGRVWRLDPAFLVFQTAVSNDGNPPKQ